MPVGPLSSSEVSAVQEIFRETFASARDLAGPIQLRLTPACTRVRHHSRLWQEVLLFTRSGTTASRPKRLFRQPGGFKRFLTIFEPLSASEHPFSEGEDNPVVDLDAARLAPQFPAHASSDPVTAITHLVKLPGARLPWLVDGDEEVPHLLASLDISLRGLATASRPKRYSDRPAAWFPGKRRGPRIGAPSSP
jgi:hypothetical protein